MARLRHKPAFALITKRPPRPGEGARLIGLDSAVSAVRVSRLLPLQPRPLSGRAHVRVDGRVVGSANLALAVDPVVAILGGQLERYVAVKRIGVSLDGAEIFAELGVLAVLRGMAFRSRLLPEALGMLAVALGREAKFA